MLSIPSLLTVLLTLVFLNATPGFVSSSSIAFAADDVRAEEMSDKGGKGDKQHGEKPKKPCGEGACVSQGANGEQSANGGQCRSGMVCTNPGMQCSLGGKHCTTYDLGGGNCTCGCL